MSNKKKIESQDEVKQHQNRGARGLEEDSVQRQREEEARFDGEGAQFQGEYNGDGHAVRGNTSPEGREGGSLSQTEQSHQGKGGVGQNNLGQLNDHDDDYQSGSKGGNRSGKSGSMQGGRQPGNRE